jgi:hypothetical protein
MKCFILLSFMSSLFHSSLAFAREIKTNSVHMADAPQWLTESRIDRVVDRIQSKMEWDVRRVEVTWSADQTSFQQMHNMGPSILAFTRAADNSIHLGPRVTSENFDALFGHEIVHVISNQKYKGVIPKWLEEGLATYFGQNDKVNYKWLGDQPFPADVRQLTHPYNVSPEHLRYHYQASQALAELIAKKCDLSNILRLSVGRNFDTYLVNVCGIKDLNADFKKWVLNHNN